MMTPTSTLQQAQEGFKKRILLNLDYWHSWLTTQENDVTEIDARSDIILQGIRFGFGLDIAWDSVYKLIVLFAPYMERRGLLISWEKILEQAIELATANGKDDRQLVELYHLSARLSLRMSKYQQSIRNYRHILRLTRKLYDRYNEARALTNLGYWFVEQGHWYRAEVLCYHALKIFELLDSSHGRAWTENHLGLLYTHQRKWDMAEDRLKRACHIWESMANDQGGLVNGYMNLGLLFIEMEKPEQALSWLLKGLEQAEGLGDQINLAKIKNNLGMAHMQTGDFEQASRYYQESETLFKNYKNTLGLAQVSGNWATFYRAKGNWDLSKRHFAESLELYKVLGNTERQAYTLLEMAKLEVTQNNKGQAAKHLAEADDLIRLESHKQEYGYLIEHLNELRNELPA